MLADYPSDTIGNRYRDGYGECEMSEEIKVGDAVTLQHVGQRMTVCRNVDGHCYCDWHGLDGKNETAAYNSECLRKISTDDRAEQLLGELAGFATGPEIYSQSPREETTTMLIGDVRVTIVRPN